MPPPRIQPQDPSMSPTYSMSTNPPQHSIAGSIRRNLFAGHLSRRAPTTTPQNLFRTSSPSNDAVTQSTIFSSAPPVQPSSRRNAPFNEIYDPNASPPHDSVPMSTTAFTRESIVALHPVTGRPLLPNLPTLPPRLRLSEDEDDEGETSDMDQDQHENMGYPRSLSRHGSMNQMSGDFGFEPDMDMDSSELERLGSGAYHNNSNSNNNSKNSSMRLNVHQFLDMNSEESHADRERIEYLLLEMVSRQSARAKTLPVATVTSTTNIDPSTSNAATNAHSLTGTSKSSLDLAANATSTRVRPHHRAAETMTTIGTQTSASATTATSKQRSRRDRDRDQDRIRDPSYSTSDPPNRPLPPSPYPTYQNQQSRPDPSTLPVGKAIDPQEKDELVGLIMTSLRRKIAIAEEEAWMYGDRISGNGANDGFGIDGAALDGDGFE